MKAKPPQILTDVYRDLRDRHLLIPALALIIALVAVPILLRNPAAEAPPPTAAVPTSGAATAVTSAVLVDDSVDVRNYRKRLAALKEKNPFESNFSLPSTGSGDASSGAPTADTGGATASTDIPATSTGATDTASTGTVPADTPGTDTGSTADTGSGSTGSDTGSTTEPAQPEIRFFAGRVDVTIGPLGKGRDYDDVKYLNFLPDDDEPLVAFIGLAGTGDSAVFAISSDVEMGEGDGSCAPKKPDPCQFLTLKPGEQRYMKYGGKTYRLKLRDTHFVTVPDPREADSGSASGAGYTPSGG